MPCLKWARSLCQISSSMLSPLCSPQSQTMTTLHPYLQEVAGVTLFFDISSQFVLLGVVLSSNFSYNKLPQTYQMNNTNLLFCNSVDWKPNTSHEGLKLRCCLGLVLPGGPREESIPLPFPRLESCPSSLSQGPLEPFDASSIACLFLISILTSFFE